MNELLDNGIGDFWLEMNERQKSRVVRSSKKSGSEKCKTTVAIRNFLLIDKERKKKSWNKQP